jgi:amidase
VRLGILMIAVPLSLAAAASRAGSETYDVVEKSVSALQSDLAAGRVTSRKLVAAYLARIEALDRSGPKLNSILSLNPDALEQAKALDEERRAGRVRSALHGIPVLLKDNIESADRMPTTAGTSALQANLTLRDSALAVRLRAGGAIILGKTNLGNWAEIQSMYAISGWSALGGLTRNPYVLDRTAGGSSSGSGAATAASLAALAVGTETDGSIISPSSFNGLVGLKPTVGLISRHGLIPISGAQDTAGPMARNVADLAILLTLMAGSDPADPATKEADAHKTDYLRELNGRARESRGQESREPRGDALKGRRLGVLRFATGRAPQVDAVFEGALTRLRALGAELIELPDFRPDPALRSDELTVMLADFKSNLNRYLPTAAPGVAVRSLADVIAYNRKNSRELALFGQDLLEAAEASPDPTDGRHVSMNEGIRRMARAEGLDGLLSGHRLDALVAPSVAPAGRVDIVRGDHSSLGVSNLPAVSGYPHLTVPMGRVGPLPVGISFIGAPWSEVVLLRLGWAFERATTARRPPEYLASLETGEPGSKWLDRPQASSLQAR